MRLDSTREIEPTRYLGEPLLAVSQSIARRLQIVSVKEESAPSGPQQW